MSDWVWVWVIACLSQLQLQAKPEAWWKILTQQPKIRIQWNNSTETENRTVSTTTDTLIALACTNWTTSHIIKSIYPFHWHCDCKCHCQSICLLSMWTECQLSWSQILGKLQQLTESSAPLTKQTCSSIIFKAPGTIYWLNQAIPSEQLQLLSLWYAFYWKIHRIYVQFTNGAGCMTGNRPL